MSTDIRTDLKNSYNADTIDTESVKDSMATMMNSLVGTDKTGDTIGNEKMGEDFVYSALVLDQLKKAEPSLAKKFAEQVKKAYKKLYNKKNRESAPLLKAVNQVLEKFVDAGKLAKNVCKTIKNVAFGKSQLDDKKANQKRKPTVIDNDKEKNNVEEVLDKITGNSIAKTRQVKKEEKKFEGKVENKKTYNRKKHFLDGLKTDPVEAKKPVDPIPPTPVVNETDFVGDTDDMVLRPKATDGKVSVVLPDGYSNGKDKVSEVVIEDLNGNVLAEGKLSDRQGVEGHERNLFRFDITQDQLPPRVTVKVKIQNTGEWVEMYFDTEEDCKKHFKSIDRWS